MPLDTMEVSITAFKPNGNEAEATVSIRLKDQPGSQPMVIPYHLQQENGKWVVTGIAGGAGGSPHGGAAPPPMPPAGNPHGGAMPSPDDLPPAGKKK